MVQKKKKFDNTFFLLFVQCFCNCLSALLAMQLFSSVSSSTKKTPIKNYLYVSIPYIGAMFCSNLAIQYVNYPTMVLAKSCKPIPVMIMGIFLLQKKYNTLKYLSVSLIILGIALFSSDEIFSKSGISGSLIGFVLLGISLALDGITGPFQEMIIRDSNPESSQMMFWCNAWSCMLLFIALIVSGRGIDGIQFCIEYPGVIPLILLFSLCGAFGQNFIYYTIFSFGSLVLSLITTTRKFFTIFLSVLWFGHSLSTVQWFGVMTVFAGLGLDIFNASFKSKTH